MSRITPKRNIVYYLKNTLKTGMVYGAATLAPLSPHYSEYTFIKTVNKANILKFSFSSFWPVVLFSFFGKQPSKFGINLHALPSFNESNHPKRKLCLISKEHLENRHDLWHTYANSSFTTIFRVLFHTNS